MAARNADHRALFHRAGNAHVAVAVDTRIKRSVVKKGRNDRKDVKRALKSGKWD